MVLVGLVIGRGLGLHATDTISELEAYQVPPSLVGWYLRYLRPWGTFASAQVTRLISDANEISDESYAKLKQKELKERCTRHGLSTNGRKKALVERLEAFRTDKKSEANQARFKQKTDLVSWIVAAACVLRMHVYANVCM